MSRQGLLIVVSAPSGAGKTTLCKEISRALPNLQHSISYTTRKPRPNETDGVHYFFVTQEKFNKMIKDKEFAEWAVVHGNLYGTSKKQLAEMMDGGIDVILDIDSQGAMQIKENWGEGVFIYILPPSFDDLRRRLTERNSDATNEIKKRLENAKKEIPHYKRYNYVIINDKFEKALEDLKSIITSERLKIDKFNTDMIDEKFNL
ncbi:MAG: guanylate kinase [Nitrospirae bacterium]|nr:guanylate kinase [Nitrospirota bacterium]